ncbi:MAG: hypothetical protein ACJ8AI_00795 [Rhodopila sp.]
MREAVETIAQAQSMQYDALCREAMQQPLRDQLGIANQQIATLTTQLGMAHEQADRERERADRAEVRAQEAESRATEFQQQLQTEMIEHRRVIATLANQLAARRSWWPFRRVRQKSL